MAAVRAPAVPPVALTTPPFPSPYPPLLLPDSKLQAALDKAIAGGPGTNWRVPVAIVSLNPDNTRSLGQFRGSEEHYSASLLKVCALYAAYELRKVMKAIATELGPAATTASFLGQAGKYLNPLIMAKAKALPLLNGIQPEHALPRYGAMFTVTSAGNGVDVDLSESYKTHIEGMIGPSHNWDARDCIHGLGYGYLNGCLVSGGFFDLVGPAGHPSGLWLAGDYTKGDGKQEYPYFEVDSINDRKVGQAASAIQLVRLYTLMNDGLLVDMSASAALLNWLTFPVLPKYDEIFINRASGLDFRVTHTKVGLGDSKPPVKSFYSEASILLHTSGRRFVVAWQNLVLGNDLFDPVGHVVRDTINEFLKS